MALGTELAINPVTLSFGGMSPLPNVQPFTLRSAASYNEILEGMRGWIKYSLIPYLDDTSAQTAFDEASAALTTAVNTALATQSTTVNAAVAAALQEVVTAQIPIAAPVVLGILEAASSTVTAWLDARYAPFQGNRINVVDGMFHVDDAGAKGDGTTDDRAAIQQCIDSAHNTYNGTGIIQHVYLSPKLYRVGTVTFYQADGTTQYGVAGLVLKTGVVICGTGTLKITGAPFGPGALYGLIRSDPHGLSHAGIKDITVDGDRSHQTTSAQCNNIFLDNAVTDIRIQNVKSYEANGNSIIIYGTGATPVSEVLIQNCKVAGANYIGIQVSQFVRLQIIGNNVTNTVDNAIDIYGENNGSTTSNGNDFIINDNSLDNFGNHGTAIFLETVAYGVCVGNRISNFDNGFHVNRINGQPIGILIEGNQVRNVVSGFVGTGDTGGVTVRNNVFMYYNTACFTMGGNGGRVSYYYFFGNVCTGNAGTTATLLIQSSTNQAANMYFADNLTTSSADFVNYATTTVAITAGTQKHLGD